MSRSCPFMGIADRKKRTRVAGQVSKAKRDGRQAEIARRFLRTLNLGAVHPSLSDQKENIRPSAKGGSSALICWGSNRALIRRFVHSCHRNIISHSSM